MKYNQRLGELYKEWDDYDFVYLYFNPNAVIEEGKHETVYLHQIGIYDLIKNSSPSIAAKAKMEEEITKIIKDRIKHEEMGQIKTPKSRIVADYRDIVFSLGRSSLYYYYIGIIDKKEDYYSANGHINVTFFDKFADPFQMDRLIEKLQKNNAPNFVVNLAKKIPTDCFGTVYDITDEWSWHFNILISEI